MSFNQKGNLNTHMLLHRSEKPHQCSVCDKAFNHKVCLVQHLKNHHGLTLEPKASLVQDQMTADLLCPAEHTNKLSVLTPPFEVGDFCT